ncbi:MAG TPA: lactate racemase domain-containing protein, partial [Pirellulales bacterium]|nr:lactate racemase domain-containing protein [Pirellulales bacterium]
MLSSLRYGINSMLDLEIDSTALVADFRSPHRAPLADPAAATAAALAAPLEFPPVRRAVIPGDRVVLAVAEGVPQAPTIIGAVISALIDAGIARADICVVHSAREPIAEIELREGLPKQFRDEIEIVAHDPAHRDQLSYLAAHEHGEAIYLNRRLFDADVVLPIGCTRLEESPGYFGPSGALYPTFSDSAAIDRFGASAVEADRDEIDRRRREADEVAWLLGVLLVIQIVPAAAGRVLHILAGNGEAVGLRSAELCRSAWAFEVSRRADLVVAAIEGGPEQQTWDNFGRAIAAASRAVADDGAIAICTDLAAPPGPALEWIGRSRDLSDAMRHIRRVHSADASAAHELGQALKRVRVYLLSKLDDSVVEEIGMAPIAAAAEVGRLAQRHSSYIVLGNAQFAAPT